MSKKIYSVSGIFHTPDDIIRAAEDTVKAGYEKFDVHTPYPVHGMDKAMNLRPSRISYVALAAGLMGLLSAFLMMYYIADIDYPMVIGGKPHGSFPAFVPVAFEVTVLVASIVTVASMLFIFFRLPNNSHPLHDTQYMKMVSNDRFGLTILASDENFEEEKARAFLASAGASDIITVYFEPEEFQTMHNIFDPKFMAFLGVAAVAAGLITYLVLNYVLFMDPFNWMQKQQKLVAQDKSGMFKNEAGMRVPVEGTVARGFMPYAYRGDQAAAAANLSNPLQSTKQTLEAGKERYNTYCSPCHGYYGQGDSRLRGQFPSPPSLHSRKVIEEWKDADIYHVITEGQNIMPAYASQITRNDRWAIVLYIRELQKNMAEK